MKTLLACAIILVVPASAVAEVEEFVETFRGTGEYATLPRMFTLEGLDNPG